jgi:hypothetical protein
MKKLIVPALAVLLAVAVPAVAHHSFPATYDVTRTISIKGKVTRFMFRNPHSLVMVDVATDKNEVQQWTVEWAAAGALARAGASRDSLKVGDEIAIVGNPGRSTTEHRIRLNSIKRASDGWGWSGEFE